MTRYVTSCKSCDVDLIVYNLLKPTMGFLEMLHMATKGGTGGSPVAEPVPTGTDCREISSAEKPKKKQPLVPTGLSEREKREQQERIQRLKAARRAEEAERNRKLAAKKSSSPRGATPKSKSGTTNPKARSSPIKKNTNGNDYETETANNGAAKKKLNFKDLMQQADQIDAEKLKLTVKVKDKTVAKSDSIGRRSRSPYIDEKLSKDFLSSPQTRSAQSTLLRPKKAEAAKPNRKPSSPASRQLASFSKPMPLLLEKRKRQLQEKRRRDYDSDLDDFIEDDEEQVVDSSHPAYDRDEIWKLFNRGRSRTYYENDYDDDSDMEATGTQVLEEESRSALYGKREDQEEEKRLERLAEEKKRRKLSK